VERKFLRKIEKRRGNSIGHILRKDCCLKHIIEGKIEGRAEVMGRRGRIRKQVLDDHR
jgi:hypothetical protein